MADVVLVNPQIGLYSSVFRPFIPLGLLAISSYLVRDGYRVKIIDQDMDRDWERTLSRCLDNRPICVGITSMTGAQLRSAIRTAKFIRSKSAIPIVWGGVHPSIFAEETLTSTYADYVIRGEGELSFYLLVQALAHGRALDRVPSLSYFSNSCVCANPNAGFLDLDTLPPVPYHLLDVRAYVHTYYYKHDVIEIETSRGCPHACGFCYNKAFNRQIWRARSAASVYTMITSLMDSYGLTSILVIDDSFFVQKNRVIALADMILERNLTVNLGFQGRLDGILAMTDDELDRLIKAGTKFLQFGVESGSPRILELINKQITLDQVRAVNQRLARYPGLYCFYNFMVGLPTETKQDVMMTVDLAWKLLKENPNANIGTIHIFKEYPGTPLYNRALQEGYSPPQTMEEWSTYDWQNAVKRDKSMELMKLIKGITVASYCVDDKIRMLGDSAVASFISRIYRPIARFRFKHKFFSFMPETRFFT